ncbi:MAG: AAA family ATPase [Anaerolineae bacterium]|nr:AAA family ATPase [Anaerolineae bacterium]
MDPKLRVQLLGDFRLYLDGAPVDTVDTPRLQSLLAFLLLHQDASQPRHYVAFLFWPDSTEQQALTNLRNLLYHLRQALPGLDRFLSVDAKSLLWRRDVACTSDVADLERAVVLAQEAERAGDMIRLRAALESASELYRGDLLPSCYDDWILPERERLRQTCIDKLVHLARLLEGEREYDGAVLAAQRLLRIDPMYEATYRQLMRLYALGGNRAAALRTYHMCVTMLRQEFGVEPDPLTRQAYERLLPTEPSSWVPLPARFELATTAPVVGRQRELVLLQANLSAAASNGPRMVVLSGVAGIGKTRLAEELLLTAYRKGATTAVARCYAAQGELPYAPAAAWLRALPIPPIDNVWLGEVSRVLPELRAEAPSPPRFGTFAESWQRQRLFEALSRVLLSGKQLLVLLLDDLQWCDRDTLEWLHYLLRFDLQAPLLIVGTLRVENLTDNPALVTLMGALRNTDQLVEIELGPLSQEATFTLADQLAGRDLDPALAHSLYLGSEGNPLFIVEMVRMERIEGGSVGVVHQEKLDLATLPLPPKVRVVLEARLGQLSPSAYELAGIAAVIGREFPYTLLAQVSCDDEDTLVGDLDELWRRRILREQGADGYDFTHDRLRAVAYDALSMARRRSLHHRVAQALEVQSAADWGAESARIALHYERAGYPEQAIPYYQRAGEAAQRTLAHEEAVRFYSRALELLGATPALPERDRRELELLLVLGVPLVLCRGHPAPEVESVYTRAGELLKRQPDSARRFSVLVGLRRYCLGHGEVSRAYDLDEQMIAQAIRMAEPMLVARGHMHHSETLYRMGAFSQAVDHSVAGYALYEAAGHDPHLLEYGSDSGVFCLIYGAIALQFMGYPDQALAQANRAINLAEQVNHPFTSCMGWILAASLHRLRRDVCATEVAVASALRIGGASGYPLALAWGTGLEGWVLIQRGQWDKGIEQLQQGIAACRSIEYSMVMIDQFVDLCEAYIDTGNSADAHHALGEAFALMEASGERCWDAELNRLQGEVALLRQDESGAEIAFRHAIDIARQQQATLLELRTSVALSRLWHRMGRKAEAREFLESIFGWFTEGLGTPDLNEAAALLSALAS